MEQILNPIYESEFYGFSYGFRPGRSAHDALDAVDRRKVGWIVEVDIREYFERIDREQLMAFLEMRIVDRRVLRLIRKWLNAGVIDAGLEVDVVRGTPQGAVISPLLANVYLHHVLDDWFAREWRPRKVWGEAYIVRYADDFVLGFQYRRDAERFMEALRERFAAFGLEVHPEKTRLVEFGRFAMTNRRERGEGRPETFDFLGFTHYCRTTHEGRFGLGRKPVAKRMRRTLQAVKAELRRRMHADPVVTGRWLGRVLRGWLGYYAVPTSSPSLSRFVWFLRRLWMRIRGLARRHHVHRRTVRQALRSALPPPRKRAPRPAPQLGRGWTAPSRCSRVRARPRLSAAQRRRRCSRRPRAPRRPG